MFKRNMMVAPYKKEVKNCCFVALKASLVNVLILVNGKLAIY